MTTVLYSAIRPAIGQRVSDVIRKASQMGYTMMLFNGWDDEDLGSRHGETKGPHRDKADTNAAILREIQEACVVHTPEGDDYPHIIDTSGPFNADYLTHDAQAVRCDDSSSPQPKGTEEMHNKRVTPNHKSTLLARAVVGGSGLGIAPELKIPEGYAAVLLFVPLEHIVGKSPVDIQNDLGLPWYCEGSDPIWFDES